MSTNADRCPRCGYSSPQDEPATFTCPGCLRIFPARFQGIGDECTDCAKEAEGRQAGPLPPPPVVLTEPGPFFITPEPPDDEPDTEGEDGA